MKNILADLLTFLQSLTLIDVLFFTSIIVLIILIVALIYIVRINNETADSEEIVEESTELEDKKKDSDDLDLAAISEAIEAEEPKPIILNDYEKEQEEKAIISYDELMATTPVEVNYKNEEDLEGLKIKNVDMENITKPIELPKINDESKEVPKITKPNNSILISYEAEEEFLKTLKKMQNLLN
jgi:Na+-transporting methylmalonyl-CoA/oxaloacetate decarboxylase gamma subunit